MEIVYNRMLVLGSIWERFLTESERSRIVRDDESRIHLSFERDRGILLDVKTHGSLRINL